MESKRTRTIKKQFWFNEEEQKALRELASQVGKNESYVIRNLVLNNKLKEKPDERFYKAIQVFTKTSNNINQIAKKAHSLGFIDELAYRKEVEKIDNFIDEIKDKFLRIKDSSDSE